jgi:hypothetical protein
MVNKGIVALDSDGFANLLFHIKRKDKVKMKLLDYKVDSGASSTTISKNALTGAGYDLKWVRENGQPISVTVANQFEVPDCYEVIVPEVSFHGFVGYNWRFVVTINANHDFRNLFGTDSMQFFRWIFDYTDTQNNCCFELLASKKVVRFNQKEQCIHSADELGIK